MKVLLVDDNAELADNLAELLASERTEVFAHHDATAALAWGRTHDFDTALLDVRMPELSGVELMRLLRVGHPAARFVLMSAYTQDAELDPTQDTVAAVLTKPLDLPSLAKVLGLDA
ncbi:MAG: response regulator [Sandaracinaceae bacterium]|nr:response regulator [Sandaracinaceae bacterium]